MSEIFEGKVGDEIGIFERKVCDRRFVLPFQPLGNGLSFICVSIGGDDGVKYLSFGDGTGGLLFEGFDEVVAFAIHLNNFYKVYQKKIVIYIRNMPCHTREWNKSIFFYTTLIVMNLFFWKLIQITFFDFC